jgi:hypothetical protein
MTNQEVSHVTLEYQNTIISRDQPFINQLGHIRHIWRTPKLIFRPCNLVWPQHQDMDVILGGLHLPARFKRQLKLARNVANESLSLILIQMHLNLGLINPISRGCLDLCDMHARCLLGPWMHWKIIQKFVRILRVTSSAMWNLEGLVRGCKSSRYGVPVQVITLKSGVQ